MRDIVFLFGAGASAGAGGILPERPPLGVELFGELERLFPGSWGALPPDVAAGLRANFEEGMAALAGRYGMAVPGLMRDMAVYFIQFRPVARDSLYNRLVTELAHRGLLERTAFSTLNYDCVLEFALLQEGAGIDYFGNGAETQVPVWKLHGSCNMFSAGVRAGPGIQYAQGVVFEGGIEAWLDSSRVIEHCLVETGLAPVMCQYMQGKPTTVSPAAIRQLQERWAQAVGTAVVLVCIGVRPYAADEHIWAPLHSASGTLLFVGDDAAFGRWALGRHSPVTRIGSRFVDALPSLFTHLEATCS